MASPSSVITMGYGTGSFAGSVNLLPTLGYGIAAQGATIVGTWSKVIEARTGKWLEARTGSTIEVHNV